MRITATLLFSLPVVLLLNGCIFKIDDGPSIKCKEPIYMSYKTFRELPAIEPARAIEHAGKIYVWGDTLYVNEPNKGIHVIDTSDKSAPKNLSFIKLPGNLDIAVKDGYLYADSFIDLVVLDVHDPRNITRVHRQEGVFAYNPLQVITDPAPYYCDADPKKGVVIGYEE